VQGFLALFFLAAGAPKLIGRGLERWTGFSGVPRPGFLEQEGKRRAGNAAADDDRAKLVRSHFYLQSMNDLSQLFRPNR
jgi:hypothetical protein